MLFYKLKKILVSIILGFIEVTLTRLKDFCRGILASSLAFGAFWEISILFSRLMIAKVGLLLIRFLVMNSLIGLIIIILLVCLSLVLFILGVMGGEGYRDLIESLIELYVMKNV